MDIARRRLTSQRLVGPGFAKAEDVVQWLVAVQSQDYASAKWGLGQRMRAATDETVERALDRGTILRTHLLRPTWHFVTASDIRWLLMLTAPRIQAANASYYRRTGLSPTMFKRSIALLARELAGGNHLTRDELRAIFGKARIPTSADQQMAYLMMQAELEAVVCSGPRRGKQFTYALLDERAPAPCSFSRDDALAELAQRFFVSRGPATVQDMARWSGLTVADARHGLESVASELQQEETDGKTYWLSAATAARQPAVTAHLLSIFDELVSGYRDRGALVSNGTGQVLALFGQALQFIAVVNGLIVGTWKRSVERGKLVVSFDLFKKLSTVQTKALNAALRRYADFIDVPLSQS